MNILKRGGIVRTVEDWEINREFKRTIWDNDKDSPCPKCIIAVTCSRSFPEKTACDKYKEFILDKVYGHVRRGID